MAEGQVSTPGAPRDPNVMAPGELSLLPLRDTVLFPQSILPLAAGRAASA